MGVSAWHGGHQLAQNVIQTGRPRSAARSTTLPSTSFRGTRAPPAVRSSGGATEPSSSPSPAGPMANWVGRGSAPADGTRGDRARHEDEHEGDADDHGHRDRELAAGERPDEPAARLRPLSLGDRGGRRCHQTPGARRARRLSQSKIIATPSATTIRPPMMLTIRPWRTSGRTTAGARS